MNYTRLAGAVALLSLGASALSACASGRSATGGSSPGGASATRPVFVPGQAGATQRARADSARLPYTKADIDFMSGMIHHHAQAITMSRWAPSHGADPAVQRLTARIINAQTDEIHLMQGWLQDRNQAIPRVDSTGKITIEMAGMAGHSMSGMDMSGKDMSSMGQMTMPGMLTDAQMKELDKSRGTEFDRLFLTYMMQHHRGAVSMVRALFASPGAGQDESVFKFANDAEVDQSTEIRRMLTMMLEMGFAPPVPGTP
ncbi:MAG: DUF305 domain-containing protein [Gemmatimonadaceae bacterium]